MPTYELEMNGKSYEVDAPSMEAATNAIKPWQMNWSGGQQAAPSGQMPWEKDWSGAGQQQPQQQGDFLHPVKPAAGSGWSGVGERLLQYPRILLGQINDAGETLGRVGRGEIDAAHPDAVAAAATIASVYPGVAGEFAGTGAQIARMAEPGYQATPKGLAPGLQAAQTAADIGAPLPAGIVSQTPGVQAATQASRRLPLVGQAIEDRVGNTINAAGNRVNEIAEDLSGGPVLDRPTAGADTRTKLQGLIEANNQKIDEAYDDLRQNHIQPNLFASPANTKAALEDIGAKRWTAGEDRTSGLADIERLISSGKPFDGLIRARSRVGKDIGANERNPNPGFPAGDMKRLYAALSQDMENAVRTNVRPGVDPMDAMTSFRAANDTAKEIIGRNANIQRLLNLRSDEGIVGGILNMTKSKTQSGNARLLGELRGQLPKEDFEKIVGIGLHELGHDPLLPGEFSLSKFARRWNDTSPMIKGILIKDQAHRKALDDIAGLGGFLKDADKYVNHSATSGGNAMSALIGAVAGGHIPEAIAGLVGGYTFGKVLARPASASALRKWIGVAHDKATGRYGLGPSGEIRGNAALSIASRNLLNNLPLKRLTGPVPYAKGDEEAQQVPIPYSDPRKKVQERYPYR